MRAVVWSADAHRDMLEILRHIAEDNPDAAERVVDALEAAGRRLGEFLTGRPGRVAGTYEKSLDRLPYIIAYETRAMAGRETIVILRVIHTARDWPDEGWPR
ncbi:type II toxin-antitoxin system RelE/ParE family toxin [Neorhizobium sp. NCHU2750]|uniref:type II toxin-antitoxin system RelE/ParE family toxin n=1 Tax=Neorhizobium sp. NCHU2750 TaxID=1825976 RepID=UPI000E706FB8|nr:plasmid stabilization protein [Neorhizobium sp. NCHU2750]